jgi:hypothetical protein
MSGSRRRRRKDTKNNSYKRLNAFYRPGFSWWFCGGKTEAGKAVQGERQRVPAYSTKRYFPESRNAQIVESPHDGKNNANCGRFLFTPAGLFNRIGGNPPHVPTLRLPGIVRELARYTARPLSGRKFSQPLIRLSWRDFTS